MASPSVPMAEWLIGISAPCDHCAPVIEVVGRARVLSTRRYRSAGVCERDPRPSRARGAPAHQEALRHDEPARRPRCPNARRLAGDCSQRPGLRLPLLLWARRSACAGVPKPVAVLDKHAAVSGVAIVTGQLGATTATAALVAEWATARCKRAPHAGPLPPPAGPVTPFLTGSEEPRPCHVGPAGDVLVGDWTRGIVYRIAARR